MPSATPEERTIEDTIDTLEQRVHRLEQAVAALGDTHLMEDRVVERIARRESAPSNGGLLSSAAKLFKGSAPKADPEPHEPPVEPVHPAEPPAAKSGWLVVEFVQEFRAALRMFADYRYRMSWTGRIVPLACIMLGVLSYFVIRLVPLVGAVLDFAIDFVLIVVLYKALSREVERYESGAGRVLR